MIKQTQVNNKDELFFYSVFALVTALLSTSLFVINSKEPNVNTQLIAITLALSSAMSTYETGKAIKNYYTFKNNEKQQ